MEVNEKFGNLKMFYKRCRAFIGRPLFVKQMNVISVSDLEYCNDPIFIFGCHRSGTTLLRRIINAHPEIACPPETHYLIHFLEMLENDKSISGIEGMVDNNDILNEIRSLAFRFHEMFRVAENKNRWADKTPEYLPYFEQIRKLAPENTKYLILKRDPFDIFYSIYVRKWRLIDCHNDLFENTIEYVKKSCLKLQEIFKDSRVFVLSYEDLATDPETVTKSICNYLEEEWDKSMLTPWLKDHNFGNEDPIVRSMKRIELSSGYWKSLSTEEISLLDNRLGLLRKELGY